MTVVAAAMVAVLIGGSIPVSAADASPGMSSGSTPVGVFVRAQMSERRTVSARRLFSQLAVRAERNAGYDRDLFDHWIDADRDGCDTREEVLIAESVIRPTTGSGCSVSGRWLSAYDGVTVTVSGSLDIDHFVPLAEAWGSGAHQWNADTRKRFANDLSYGPSLIAVTASTNRSKSDRDPAEWMPPASGYHCSYVAQWVAVKWRWRLTIDTREKSAVQSTFTRCPASALLVVKPSRPAIGTGGGGSGGGSGGSGGGGGGSGGGSGGGGGVPANPGDTKNCTSFATWKDAQAWFDLYFPHYGDVARLDSDGDGIACETLPGAP